MDRLIALAVSTGVLIALWVKLGPMASLAVPTGVVAWALVFAAGGRTPGLQKVIGSTVSGVVWVWLAHAIISVMGVASMTWIVIGVVAFVLVLQSKLPLLSFIPGAFCGAAVTSWTQPPSPKGYVMVAVSLVAGAVLGYASELGAGMIAKKV